MDRFSWELRRSSPALRRWLRLRGFGKGKEAEQVFTPTACYVIRIAQSGESRLWRLVISLLFVAGHRNVAGQRARMSRAFSLKVSAPLSTTRDYHARLTSGSPSTSNGGDMFLFLLTVFAVFVGLVIWSMVASDNKNQIVQDQKKASLLALENFAPELIWSGAANGYGLAIDPASNQFAISIPGHEARIYHFCQLVAVEAIRDGETITTTKGKVDMKGAAVGTALLGPIGLLAGAKTSSSSQTTAMISDLNLKIFVNDFYSPSFEIKFFIFGIPLEATHKFVQDAARELDAWYGRFRTILNGLERRNFQDIDRLSIEYQSAAPLPKY